jgi:c-di-GMP-binding flagellar brake protein YcgR
VAEEKRRHPRAKICVPVELRVEDSELLMRATTSDISLGGCYVEMMFTLERDAQLEMTFDVGERILVLGRVVTCDPHVGNGIEFSKILPEDEEVLRRYLEAASDIPASH